MGHLRARRTNSPSGKRTSSRTRPRPIPWDDALEAQGRADMIEVVEKQDRLERYLDTVFGV